MDEQEASADTRLSTLTIINELLCYVQNKMENMPTDELCKIVIEFYTGGQIESAKTVLYESCEEVDGERMKKRKQPNKHLNNVRDIIDRFNEVGLAAPQFVARNLTDMPPSTLGGFDIARIVKSLADMAEVFGVLKCLQEDLGAVQQQFAGLQNLAKEVADIKEIIMLKPVSKDTSKVAAETADRRKHTDADELKRHNNKRSSDSSEAESSKQVDASPTEADDESDGFQVPRKKRRLKRKIQPKRTYAETAGSAPTVRSQEKPTTLRSYKKSTTDVQADTGSKLRAAPRRINMPEKDVEAEQRHSFAKLFVSRLHIETTVTEVKDHLGLVCKDQVRVQRLETRTTDYASFKVSVPAKAKAKLMSKKCWPEGANVRNYVDKFTR